MIRQIRFSLVMMLTIGACGGKNAGSPQGHSPPAALTAEPINDAESPQGEQVEALKEDVEVPPAP